MCSIIFIIWTLYEHQLEERPLVAVLLLDAITFTLGIYIGGFL